MRLNVSPDIPWTIGRALGAMELHRVFLVVDDTASEQFRRWIEELEDIRGSLAHFDSVAWSPQNHKKYFAQNTRAFELLLLAQKGGHPLFGSLGRDLLVDCIFSSFVRPVYVKHVSYEPQGADWDEAGEEDKRVWLEALFEYWVKQVDEFGWEGHEFAEMGVSVCGEPDEDSVCCRFANCAMCTAFKETAEQHGIYL